MDVQEQGTTTKKRKLDSKEDSDGDSDGGPEVDWEATEASFKKAKTGTSPMMDIEFKVAPPKWQTKACNIGNAFRIYDDGQIEEGYATREIIKEVAFPSSITIKNNKANVKRARAMCGLINLGYTARTFNVTREGVTFLEIQFGRTVKGDLEYLPEFNLSKAEEEKTQEVIRRTKIRELAFSMPVLPTPPVSFCIANISAFVVRAEALMTEDDKKRWAVAQMHNLRSFLACM